VSDRRFPGNFRLLPFRWFRHSDRAVRPPALIPLQFFLGGNPRADVGKFFFDFLDFFFRAVFKIHHHVTSRRQLLLFCRTIVSQSRESLEICASLADESPEHQNFSPETLVGGTVRMVMIVDDPDAAFARAVAAGAAVVWPVGNQYGWRLGRVVDPFGHHWEIGKPMS